MFISKISETLRAKRLKNLMARGANAEDFENRGYGKNKSAVCHKFGTDDEHTIYVPRPAMSAHMGHGDAEGMCAGDSDEGDDEEEGEEDEDEDVTAPGVSDVVIADVTDVAVSVSFDTDEDTTAVVYFSTTSPVDTETADSVASVTLAGSHDVDLTGLTAETTYHVVIVATDEAGNETTTTEETFTTGVTDVTAPVVSNIIIADVTDVSALVAFDTDETTTAAIYYSTTSPVNLGIAGSESVVVADSSHEVLLSSLHPETTYYVVIVATDASGNETTTLEEVFTTEAPDVIAPIVSNLVIADVTDVVASVSFDTNEDTTAVVYFSTTSPVDTGTADSIASVTLAGSHNVDIVGLIAETSYYVVIVVTDEAENEATTTEEIFTTTEVPDTTAPVVSNIVIADVLDVSASVSFDTDEDSTAIVYYSTTSPVDTGTADSEVSAVLAGSHSVELTGLIASTSYYVVIVATDNETNEATTTEETFETLATA